MSRKFKIIKDPYFDGENIFKKSMITFNPGVTVLVGCNGSGKTTLIRLLKENLEKKNISSISFNNLYEGGTNATSLYGFMGDMSFVAESVMSSEGENIVMNLGKFASKIGRWVRHHKDEKELWIFLDACDSGLSIDNILDVKKYLFDVIIDDNPNTDVYIVVAANAYEMANGEQCYDVYNGEYITFSNYDEYRNMILQSKRNKETRENKKEEV